MPHCYNALLVAVFLPLDLCNNLEKQGYSDIEYQNSDEAIIDTIEANDYEFLSNGKQF